MLGQVRLSQVRLGKVRLRQVRLGNVRLGQIRLDYVRLEQVRLGQVRLDYVRLRQVRLGKVRLYKVSLGVFGYNYLHILRDFDIAPIGEEEQKKETRSGTPTQLPWTVHSPPTTRRDQTVTLF